MVHGSHTAVTHSNSGLIGVLYAVNLVDAGASLIIVHIEQSLRNVDEHIYLHTPAKARYEYPALAGTHT